MQPEMRPPPQPPRKASLALRAPIPPDIGVLRCEGSESAILGPGGAGGRGGAQVQQRGAERLRSNSGAATQAVLHRGLDKHGLCCNGLSPRVEPPPPMRTPPIPDPSTSSDGVLLSAVQPDALDGRRPQVQAVVRARDQVRQEAVRHRHQGPQPAQRRWQFVVGIPVQIPPPPQLAVLTEDPQGLPCGRRAAQASSKSEAFAALGTLWTRVGKVGPRGSPKLRPGSGSQSSDFEPPAPWDVAEPIV